MQRLDVVAACQNFLRYWLVNCWDVCSPQEDVPLKSKMREIEKVYAKARSSGKKIQKGKKGGKKVRGPVHWLLQNRLWCGTFLARALGKKPCCRYSG